VEAVIAMGEHLGLEIVAEGVETLEQQLILQEAGCHRYQGFLFSRPLPLEEAGILLAASGETLFGKRREDPLEAEEALI
jgi:EAL domain-containing protein (putative c-di-GMP-specific phosphodiesterase class I)